MYPVTSTGKRTVIKRPVIVDCLPRNFSSFVKTHKLIANFLFSDPEAVEISVSLG